MKYLLDEKKNDIDKKAKEIQSFLNNYGDLNTYLTKEFSLSKRAMGSLLMFKKKEEDEILKNQKLPSEVGLILKFICYLLDEKFDENMNEKDLDKNDDKTFKGLLVNYFNKNKFLNLTQEKVDNMNKLVNENNKILVMTEISKSCRPFGYFCFSLKEIFDYMNLKTSDGHHYYELREKNKQLQNYLDFIYMYENNGKQRTPKEEKKEETNAEKTKEENVEKSEEQNTENTEKPKEENLEQNEEHKNEEMKVEEESVKKEENNEQNEQPPQE